MDKKKKKQLNPEFSTILLLNFKTLYCKRLFQRFLYQISVKSRKFIFGRMKIMSQFHNH